MTLKSISLLLENTNYEELVHTQIIKHLTKLGFKSEHNTGDLMTDFIADSQNIYPDRMTDPDSKERLRVLESQNQILMNIVQTLTNYGTHIRSKYIKNWKDKVANRSVMHEYFDLLSATFAKGELSVEPYMSGHEPVIELPNDNDNVIETFMNFAGGSAKMARETGIPGINNIREYTKGCLAGSTTFNGFASLQEVVRAHVAKEEVVSDVATDDVEQLPSGLLIMAKEQVKDENGKNTGEIWWLYAVPSTCGKDDAACDQLASAAKEAAVGLTRSGGERGGKEGIVQGSDAVWCFRNYNVALNYLKWCSLLIIYHQAIENGVIKRAIPIHAGTLPNNDTLSNNGHLLNKVEFKDENNSPKPIPRNIPASIRLKYMHLIRSNNALLAYESKTGDKSALTDATLIHYLYSDPANSVNLLSARQANGGLTQEIVESIRQKLYNPPKGISKSPYCLLIEALVSASRKFKEIVLEMSSNDNGPILAKLFKIMATLPMPRRILSRIGMAGGTETQDSYVMLSKTAENIKSKIGKFEGDLELICVLPLKLEFYVSLLSENDIEYSPQILDRLYAQSKALYQQADFKNPSVYERDVCHTIPIVAGSMFKAAGMAATPSEAKLARHAVADKFRDLIKSISERASQSIIRSIGKDDLSLIYVDDSAYHTATLAKTIADKFLNDKEKTPEITTVKILADNNMLAEDLPISDPATKTMVVDKINRYVDQYEASIGTPNFKKTSIFFKLPEYSAMRKNAKTPI